MSDSNDTFEKSDQTGIFENQVLKNAEDLSSLVKSERIKRKALEIVNKQLQYFSNQLKSSLQETNQAYLETINKLVLACEFKDDDTGDHIKRMSRYSSILAKGLELSEEDVNDIVLASPMHDIGKVGISDHIMRKPGKLDADEFEAMKQHTFIGAKILSGSQSSLLNLAENIALHHHEKWDGTGYPNGLSGEEISLGGRIVSLADILDALTSKRPYKDPYPFHIAKDIILKGKETFFDPKIIDVFIDRADEFMRAKVEIEGKSLPSDIDDFQLSERDT